MQSGLSPRHRQVDVSQNFRVQQCTVQFPLGIIHLVALAQSIDLSPVQTLLQGIVDAITGPLGIVIGTLALIGVFLSWLFGILDFRQALWVVVAIAGIAAAPTIVAAIWTT